MLLALAILAGCGNDDATGASTGASTGNVDTPSGSTAESTGEGHDADSASDSDEQATNVLVQVTPPRRGEIRETLTLSGDLRAEYSIDLTSRVGAVVERVEVRPGDRVEKGTLLLLLEDHQFRNAALQEEQAHEEALERAKSALLDTAEATQSEALKRLTLERAEKEYRRLEAVVGADSTDAFSLEEIEAKRYARDEAKLSHQSAKIAIQRSEVAKLLADIAVKQAAARWERARLELSYCEVRSSIAGTVALLEVREGEMVQQGAVVSSIVNTELLYTEVGVPQRQLPRLRLGQEVELSLETYPDQTFEGRVDAIYPTVDPTEGTVKVRVGVLNPKQQLLPGIYVSARIVLEERDNALLVPKRARLFDGDQAILFVVRNDRALRIPVQVGFQSTLEMEIVESSSDASDGALPDERRLRDDDVVVIRGHTKLDDGAGVEIQESAPAAPRQS